MLSKIEKLINRIKDPSLESELLEELALLDENESCVFINELLSHNDSLVRRFGLSLIKKLSWNKNHLLAFMEKGFLLKNSSEIRYWYEAIVPQLGFESILELLDTYIEKDPDIVQRSWYYLDLMIGSRFKDLDNKLKLIQTKFREKNGRDIWVIN